MIQPIKKNHYNKTYKVLAQTIGLIVCLFFLFSFAGEYLPEIMKGKGDDYLHLLPFLAIPIAGYIAAAWFSENIGTLLLIGGGVLLTGYLIYKGETGSAFLYGLPFIVTGGLFALHMHKRKELKIKK